MYSRTAGKNFPAGGVSPFCPIPCGAAGGMIGNLLCRLRRQVRKPHPQVRKQYGLADPNGNNERTGGHSRRKEGRHQLQRVGDKTYIETTKTNAGKRIIPMGEDVYEAFCRILKNRPKMQVEPMIDGYGGFLWLDKDGKPMVALHWVKYFQHAVEKYNKIYRVQLPKITPHV